MTQALQPPKRKNPVLRTPQPTLPPVARSRIAQGLTSAAARGTFELQACRDCAAVQYPPREACRVCLSDRLDWRPQDGTGTLLSTTELRHAYELYFRERLPRHVGMVRLQAGVTLIAYIHGDCPPPPAPVRVTVRLDRSGQAILIALPEKDTPHMTDDPLLRETSCDPRFRKVLVTDGTSPLGQAMVRAMAAAGAEIIWVGYAEPWRADPGFESLREIPQVTLLPLDVTDSDSVRDLAGQIAGNVDILVNTAEFHRTHSALSRRGVETARAELEVNYLGLLRLAQEFAPAMAARGADGASHAVAWVNLLSVYVLSNFPPHGTFSASKAAACSLAQGLRAELRHAGIRVVNVFPGPVEEPWNQTILPPKITPQALADAVVAALKDGVEDVYPDAVSREWYARWRDDPKVLERELAE